jgi:hypothetical protein
VTVDDAEAEPVAALAAKFIDRERFRLDAEDEIERLLGGDGCAEAMP